ncbi:nitrogenase component 1 [Anaerosporobacter sp.]
MGNRNSLEYTCPSHGGWGMVRIGMLIPESHQLFVCPSACGRHGALGAIEQGLKKRLSYLYIDESDVISGYDNEIYEAVEELFKRLHQKPKVLVVFVSCLDDLIGTDGEAIIEELSRRYPDVRFRMAHMNPISGNSDTPPLVNIWRSVYGLMECDVEQKNRGINMIGNYVPFNEECEIFDIMKRLGFQIHHIGNCETYEQLKNMGNNCLNLLTAAPVLKAAQELKNTQGIEYIKGYINYRLDVIKENYYAILDKLKEIGMLSEGDAAMSDIEKILAENEIKATKAIQQALEVVGDRKLYIDYSAFGNPLAAGRFFYEQGFSIERVYVKDIDETDEDYQWITKETQIEIIKINRHNVVNEWKETDDSISIGLESAYVSGSKHVVSFFQDEAMYGYHGICMLMEKLAESVKEEADLNQMINHAGLVV